MWSEESDVRVFLNLNFWKRTECGDFFPVWLRNVLRATTACTFLNISTSKSTPNMRCCFKMCFAPLQVLISHPTRWLCTCRFIEPTFRPSGAAKHWKKQYFATFLPLCTLYSSFFWLVLFSVFFFLSLLCLFPPLLLHLSIIFVGSLASKFHSIISSYPSNFQPFKDCRLLRHLWPWPGRPSEASTSSRGGVRRLHQGVFSLFCPVQCWSRHHSLT